MSAYSHGAGVLVCVCPYVSVGERGRLAGCHYAYDTDTVGSECVVGFGILWYVPMCGSNTVKAGDMKTDTVSFEPCKALEHQGGLSRVFCHSASRRNAFYVYRSILT